jgi:hypothetical protein
LDVIDLAKTDEVYAAEEAVKDAERELDLLIRHRKEDWKIKDARKEVDKAKGQLRTAERRR